MKLISLNIDGIGGQIGGSNPPVPTGGIGEVAKIITVALQFIFLFAILAALFMLIFSGFMWITSSGDKQKLQQSRQRLIFTLVGLVIIFLSYFIVNLITGFFGIDFTKLPLSFLPKS